MYKLLCNYCGTNCDLVMLDSYPNVLCMECYRDKLEEDSEEEDE